MPQAASFSPDVAAYVARCEAAFPPDFAGYALARQREMYRDLCQAFETPRPPGVTVSERRIPASGRDIPIRIYRPPGRAVQACLLYLHGGGWIYGDLDSHDEITAELAAKAGLTVVAVDYRLAPEHPHPAAVEDGAAALDWVARNAADLGIDPARLGVGGDSAGGGLSASLCLRARAGEGPPIRAQVLIYPGLGLQLDRGRSALGPDAPLLSRDEMQYYLEAYLGGAAATADPLAAPLLARDYAGLPPAYISVAAHDPLCNDGRVYAERLRAAGVSAELDIAPGLVHGHLRARGCCAEAAEAFGAVCRAAAHLLDSGVQPRR